MALGFAAAPGLLLCGCAGPLGPPDRAPVSRVVVHLVPGLTARDLPADVSTVSVARAQMGFGAAGVLGAAAGGREANEARQLGQGGATSARLGPDVAAGRSGRIEARGPLARLLVGRVPPGRSGAVRLEVDTESRSTARTDLGMVGLGPRSSQVTVWAGLPVSGNTAEVAVWGVFPGGLLSSATTGVTGKVASADLAPTVLWALGLPPDPAMAGAPWRTVARNVWNGGGLPFGAIGPGDPWGAPHPERGGPGSEGAGPVAPRGTWRGEYA